MWSRNVDSEKRHILFQITTRSESGKKGLQGQSHSPLGRQLTSTISLEYHARVNIQSDNSSINISSVTNEELFAGIASAINGHVANVEQRTEMLDKLDALKRADDKTVGERYREFIATAADHMTLLTPFLPALTALLIGMK